MRFIPIQCTALARFGRIGCVCVLAACKGKDDLHSAPPSQPTSNPSAVARALHVDASTFEPSIDPPAPAGDLKNDVTNFTTIADCVQTRTQLDPLVADALDSIGYETFLFDACRTLDAIKNKDTKRCLPIESSFLQRRCERDVAMVASDESRCPYEIPTRHEYGRDALCVAVASRTPALCAGVSIVDRARCEALASGDKALCGRIPFASAKARCEREASRWSTILDGPRKATTIAAPKGKLRISPVDGSTGAGAPETDLLMLLSRGIVVREIAGETRFTFGTFRESGATTFAPSPTVATTFTADLITTPKSTELHRLELAIPNSVTLAVPGTPHTLKVVVTKLERTRGGEVQVAIEGDIGSAPKKFHLRAELATFVRDVVTD